MNRILAIYDSNRVGQSTEAPLLSWRLHEGGSWMGPASDGDLTGLANDQAATQAEVWLALAGPEVVLINAAFTAKDKRHLAKLMPYELEEDILGDVDEFHFAYGIPRNDHVAVAYTPKSWLETLLLQFEQAGLEVSAVVPLPLMIPWADNQWSLRWLGGEHPVEVRYAKDLAFTLPLELIPISLLALKAEVAEIGQPLEQIKLFGETFEDLQNLQEQLPESMQEIATSAQWDQWMSLSMELIPAINLRQQSLSRTLPVGRWWATWRPAAVAAAIALVLFLGSTWTTVKQLQSQQKNHLAAAERAYRSVVPQGALVDPEKQLKTQLARYKSSNSDKADNAIALLATVTPIMTNYQQIKVRNLHYVDGDLRLNVESPDFRQIDQLRSSLETRQLAAELLGTTSVANGVQARLKIRSSS